MKRTELRVDNIVAYKGLAYKVIGISTTHILLMVDEIETILVDVENLEPVPITEELLTKCGFDEPCDGVYEHGFGKFEVTKEGDEWWVSWHGGCDYWFAIKYLHQLQNAYQLVTKEELTLQL